MSKSESNSEQVLSIVDMGSSSRDIQQQVIHEQVETLFKLLPFIYVGSPFLALFLVITLWSTASHFALSVWLLLQVAIAVAWFSSWLSYRRSIHSWQDVEGIHRNCRWCLGLAVITGLIWGASAVLFFDPAYPTSIFFVCMVLAGINIAPLIGTSVVFSVYLCFMLLSLLPLALHAAVIGGVYWWVAVLTLGAVVANSVFAWVNHRILIGAFRLRIENTLLAERLQEEKENAEQISQARTRFLAAASHDLRQPLQAQRLFAEAMKVRAGDGELGTLSAKIVESQQSMQSILDSLLDISKLDAGMLTPECRDVAIKPVFLRLESEFAPAAAAKGLGFHVRWPSAATHTDISLLERILRNLIANAIRYTDQGSIMLACRRQGAGWRLEVRDSGIGIPQHLQTDIFDEFRQLGNPERDRSKGLGLGLAIVKRLCHLLDHKVSVRSSSGHGSVFSVHVPLSQMPLEQPVTEHAVLSLKGVRVLMVDDEQPIREALASMLSYHGMQMMGAGNLKQAEEMVGKHVPDVMIVDCHLPEEVSGLDVVHSLHAIAGRKIPALLLTGDTSSDYVHEAKLSGLPLLHKPVEPNVLLLELKQLLS